MKRWLLWTAVGVAAFRLLAGCSSSTDESLRDSASSAEPVNGGTAVIGIIAEPDNFIDAVSTTRASQDMIDQMFMSLATLASDLESYEADLATHWDHAEDGLAVTFHLAPDAKWHDGTPVTAADVVFTHDLLTDPQVGYAARSWKDFITNVVQVDLHTVRFEFSRNYPYQIMDASVGLILPKHLLGDAPRGDLASTEFARNPVGNGPFRFSRWVAQQFVELVANEDFHLGRPHLDRVVFRVVPDKTALITQLETGEIDVMEDLPPHEVERVHTAMGGIRVEAFEGRNYTYIGWDSTNPLFASAQVRRALGMAIDRQGIIDALCYGFAQPMEGPIHSRLWAHNPDLERLPFDPAAAKKILEQEGWVDTDGDGILDKDGVPFSFELKTNLGNQVRMDATVMIQSMFEKIGVHIEPRTYEWNVLWGTVIDHSYETAVLVGWSIALKIDMKTTFHSESITEKYNHTEYSNAEVDEHIDAALASATFEDARPHWFRIQELIVQDQPYTFLYTIQKIFGVNQRIQGTKPDFRGYYLSLEDWWIPEDRQRHR